MLNEASTKSANNCWAKRQPRSMATSTMHDRRLRCPRAGPRRGNAYDADQEDNGGKALWRKDSNNIVAYGVVPQVQQYRHAFNNYCSDSGEWNESR